MAVLLWPIGGHYLGFPSTQCNDVRLTYVQIDNKIETDYSLDVGLVGMTQPAHVTQFDSITICHQIALFYSN